jgi:hypothetical protein
MAESTNLETKPGEVIGLAMAAHEATGKVAKLVDDNPLREVLARMEREAEDTKNRETALAGTFKGKTGILDAARSVKAKGAHKLSTYLDEEAHGLDGFEFLAMAEAGEVGHRQVLRTLTAARATPASASWSTGRSRSSSAT